MLMLFLYNLTNMSRRPTHLSTLMDLLLAHRVEWCKESWFIDPFEYLSCPVAGVK